MRCRFRRWIFGLISLIAFTVLHHIYTPTRESHKSQSSFQIISHQNHTYRILSSSYRYNSRGIYLNFAYFNVEQRDRVLHIDFLHDVPISSQWKSNGHLYPTQIAQYGLSHWSRFMSNSTTQSNDIHRFERLQPTKLSPSSLSGENTVCSAWHSLSTKLLLANSFIHFTISSNTSLHIQFINNDIELIYSTLINNDLSVTKKIYIPLQGSPRSVNRHMLIDIEKSLRTSLALKSDWIQIQVCGQSNSFIDQLIIGNQTLYNQQAFYSATKWLLKSQDLQTGCWFIHIQRTYGNQYHLRMPWCSAMAQGFISSEIHNFHGICLFDLGQAASLFVRLYSVTNNHAHLLAIRRAIQPVWSSNITRAYLNHRFLWLEEYPLNSSSKGLFVLNGCLYAFIGLIDVYTIDRQPYLFDLINEILHSLHHMLPYYIHPQISTWSLYDLSHITMRTKFNSASYSYHLVHITLLQCLSEIFRTRNSSMSEFFASYARRFQSAIVL